MYAPRRRNSPWAKLKMPIMLAMMPSPITTRTVIALKLRRSNAMPVTPSKAERTPASRRVSDTHSAFRREESGAAFMQSPREI